MDLNNRDSVSYVLFFASFFFWEIFHFIFGSVFHLSI